MWEPWVIKLGKSDLILDAFLCLMRFGDQKEEEVRRHDGASSDGYLAHIFRHAAKELFNEDVGAVTYRTLRCVGTRAVCLCGQCCLSRQGPQSHAHVFACVHVCVYMLESCL